jgi:hypothetical protein
VAVHASVFNGLRELRVNLTLKRNRIPERMGAIFLRGAAVHLVQSRVGDDSACKSS